MKHFFTLLANTLTAISFLGFNKKSKSKISSSQILRTKNGSLALKFSLLLFVTFFASNIFAAPVPFYVSKEGLNISPYDSWENAAHGIQVVVDLAELSAGPHNIYVDYKVTEYGE